MCDYERFGAFSDCTKLHTVVVASLSDDSYSCVDAEIVLALGCGCARTLERSGAGCCECVG